MGQQHAQDHMQSITVSLDGPGWLGPSKRNRWDNSNRFGTGWMPVPSPSQHYQRNAMKEK